MLDRNQFSQGLTLASVIALAFYPNSFGASVAIVASVGLVAFQCWLDRERDERLKRLEGSIQEVKNKVEGLMIAKGLGR